MEERVAKDTEDIKVEIIPEIAKELKVDVEDACSDQIDNDEEFDNDIGDDENVAILKRLMEERVAKDTEDIKVEIIPEIAKELKVDVEDACSDQIDNDEEFDNDIGDDENVAILKRLMEERVAKDTEDIKVEIIPEIAKELKVDVEDACSDQIDNDEEFDNDIDDDENVAILKRLMEEHVVKGTEDLKFEIKEEVGDPYVEDACSDQIDNDEEFDHDIDESESKSIEDDKFEIKIEVEDTDLQTYADLFHQDKQSNLDMIENHDEKEANPVDAEHKSNVQTRFKITGSPYICTICPDSQTYETADELRKHRRKSHANKRKRIACEICQKPFEQYKLPEHMRSHTKEKPYQCNVCSQSFSLNSNLKRHEMTHTGARPHICSVCGKGFIQSNSLYAHEKSHSHVSSKSSFKCQLCGLIYRRLHSFNAHLDSHLSDNEMILKEKQFSVPLLTCEHVCHICGRAYTTKQVLANHLLSHGDRKFICTECGKSYVTKVALRNHTRVHTGEKPYRCLVCNKSFTQSGGVNSHMLIHSGQKPYSCKLCSKKFTQRAHLIYHSRTHSGERPYACSYCDRSFALKGNLKVHVRTHTGETPYVCSICNRGFYDSSSMKRHKMKHSPSDVEPEVNCEPIEAARRTDSSITSD